MSDQPQPSVEPIFQPSNELINITDRSKIVSFAGWMLFWFGIALIGVFVLLYDPTVRTQDGDEVNFSREVTRLAGVVVGSALFIAGIIIVLFGRLERTLAQIASLK